MINNKRGVTLIELLAYLALVSIVITLLTSTMSYAVQSFDNVSGRGGVYTEANMIMSVLMTEANAFNPQYVTTCSDNCVELVIQTHKEIDSKLGLIVEVPDYKSAQIHFVKTNEDLNSKVYDVYIGAMKLNHSRYGIYYDDSTPETLKNSASIKTYCYDNNSDVNATTCQKFVLDIKLSIIRLNSNGNQLSDTPFIFENRFAF